MSTPPKKHPSFSAAHRFGIGVDRLLRTALVLAVVVMANFLAAKYFHRFYLSQQTSVELSSRTLNILKSITNRVEVTLYYDTHDRENFYSEIVSLLGAYQDANKKITVRTVDYTRDPVAAMKTKERYNLPVSLASPNAPPAKDLVIFACGDRHSVVPGAAIVNYQTVQMRPDDPGYDPKEKRIQMMRKPVSFNGEVMFTSKLLALTHKQPLQSYFLQGHGESSLEDTADGGFQKFAMALAQNDIMIKNLELLGLPDVPADCGLLVIAAPIKELQPAELEKIDRYLSQGGRLLMMFNYFSRRIQTGLEPILQRWGVNVLPDYVSDPRSSGSDQVVIVRNFNGKTFVGPLSQLALEMVLPRPILKVEQPRQAANLPQVDALVASSELSTLAMDSTAPPRSYPLIVSVEQKPAAGIVSTRGSTRMVIAGDSLFLDNQLIETAANRDFLNYAVNWLCNREHLLAGIGPKPVIQFRLVLTDMQRTQIRWLLLGALPGGVLLFGWLVWLVRRK
jgi:ABC-type uncharacterized transport system involved in gliding motility auxiliary subunit